MKGRSRKAKVRDKTEKKEHRSVTKTQRVVYRQKTRTEKKIQGEENSKSQ